MLFIDFSGYNYRKLRDFLPRGTCYGRFKYNLLQCLYSVHILYTVFITVPIQCAYTVFWPQPTVEIQTVQAAGISTSFYIQSETVFLDIREFIRKPGVSKFLTGQCVYCTSSTLLVLQTPGWLGFRACISRPTRHKQFPWKLGVSQQTPSLGILSDLNLKGK